MSRQLAWLFERWLALTAVLLGQDRRSGLPHGGVHHLQGRESDFRHSIVFQNIYHIGDPRTGGLSSHVPGKAEVVLWNLVH